MNEPLDVPVVTLSELRRRLGRSQAEVAAAVGTSQSGVSRMEHQSDMHVSTLGEYVRALGGRLRLIVEHGDGRAEIGIPSLQPKQLARRREFRVIWQDQVTRRFVHVGWLEFTGEEFLFSYTDQARSHPRFQSFPRLPFSEEAHRSGELFAFFALRVTSTADPQHEAVLDALGLDHDEATPAELLARLPESPHDTIQVVPEPTELPDGTTTRVFLASGARHADEQDPDTVSRLIEKLPAGTALNLVPEPRNPHNHRALHLTADGTKIGWVPDYLLAEIHGYLDTGRPLSVAVVRANGPDIPWHLRLLCRLTAHPAPPAHTKPPNPGTAHPAPPAHTKPPNPGTTCPPNPRADPTSRPTDSPAP